MNASRIARFSLVLILLGIASPGWAESAARRDRPLKIIQTTTPAFPLAPEMQSILSGQVQLIINVDADGRLADWLVTSYTHPDFVETAVKALKEWQYEPARQRGEAVGTRAGVALSFEVQGRIISLNSLENISSQMGQMMAVHKTTERVCLPRELDQPLKALQTVMPLPPAPSPAGRAGSNIVVIDFYVDEAGRPRMPVVLNVDNQVMAESALQALMQWRYTAPTREGAPVAVRAQQTFVFPKSS